MCGNALTWPDMSSEASGLGYFAVAAVHDLALLQFNSM